MRVGTLMHEARRLIDEGGDLPAGGVAHEPGGTILTRA